MERHSYERWCGGAIVVVYPTSMLCCFGGGVHQQAAIVVSPSALAWSIDLVVCPLPRCGVVLGIL